MKRHKYAGWVDPINGEKPSKVCPDCGDIFTAYYYRMHRGPSWNEKCNWMEWPLEEVTISWLTGNIYNRKFLEIAQSRGYDDEAHRKALAEDLTGNLDSTDIVLTHPFNWLTEEEADEAAGGPK